MSWKNDLPMPQNLKKKTRSVWFSKRLAPHRPTERITAMKVCFTFVFHMFQPQTSSFRVTCLWCIQSTEKKVEINPTSKPRSISHFKNDTLYKPTQTYTQLDMCIHHGHLLRLSSQQGVYCCSKILARTISGAAVWYHLIFTIKTITYHHSSFIISLSDHIIRYHIIIFWSPN